MVHPRVCFRFEHEYNYGYGVAGVLIDNETLLNRICFFGMHQRPRGYFTREDFVLVEDNKSALGRVAYML